MKITPHMDIPALQRRMGNGATRREAQALCLLLNGAEGIHWTDTNDVPPDDWRQLLRKAILSL